MDKRTVAIIVTGVALLLCGCPGLFGVLMGGMFAIISFIPGASIDVMGSSDPQSALGFGLGSLCVGIVAVLIAVVAIVVAWRRSRTGTPVPPAM